MRQIIRFGSAVAVLAGLVGVRPAVAATIYDDAFTDGVAGPQWTRVVDNPAGLNLVEQSGRLDLIASAGGTVNDDALYLSNFRLSTADSFRVRIDYSFTGYATAGPTDTAIGLAFGVGRDLDGTDAAAIGQGYGTRDVMIGPFNVPITTSAGVVGGRTDDQTFGGTPDLTNPTTGTFEIVYDAAGDDLTLQRVGGGVTLTIPDVVRGVWGADDLLVSFGGRGFGFTTTAGQAFFDNFRIDYGTIAVPEPAGMAVVAAGLLGVAVRRRRR